MRKAITSELSGSHLSNAKGDGSDNKTLKLSGLSPKLIRTMPQEKRWWQLLQLATLAIGLVLAGCDGDPAPKNEVVKVGVLHSQTGTMAESEKPVLDATLLAIEDVNKRELIPGVTVVPVVVDGASDPDTFARKAEELIRDEGVVAIFGCWTSASRKAVKPVVEKYGNLLFYPVQYEGIESSPNIVYLGAAPNQQIIPSIYWAKQELGAKKFFLVGSDYVFPHAANAIIKDQLKAFGLELAGEAYLPLGSNNVTSVIQQIQVAQPDIIINTLNGSTNKPFFQALRDAGITPDDIPTMSYSLDENALRSIGARNLTGDYAAWNYFQSLDSPENETWIEAFQERYGADRLTSDPMEAAWVGVHLWAQAAQATAPALSGKPSPANCNPSKVAQHIGNQSFKGPSGLLFIHPENLHLYKIARVGKIEPGGQFRVVWSSDVAVRPLPYPIFRSEDAWQDFLYTLNRSWGGAWTAPTPQ